MRTPIPPYLNAANFQIFVDLFAQAFPDSLKLLVLDNSGPIRPSNSACQ
jgi:hypothetical protein